MAASGGRWVGKTFAPAALVNAKGRKALENFRKKAGEDVAKGLKSQRKKEDDYAHTGVSHRGRKAARTRMEKGEQRLQRKGRVLHLANKMFHDDKKNQKDAQAGTAKRRNRGLNVMDYKE